jgi:hypothetical protein
MSNDQLWILLGRSPRPTAPPFFAAKVARRIAHPPKRRRSFGWPLFRWLAPAALAALVLLALLPRPTTETPAPDLTTLDLLEMLSPEDHEILTQAGWPYNDSGALTAGW